jgi:hypothetical protein
MYSVLKKYRCRLSLCVGNTWCRLLIEYATGIYSGSIYNDSSLMKALPGEVHCSKRVSVIKAHPFSVDFLTAIKTKSVDKSHDKCLEGKNDFILVSKDSR